MAKDKYTAVWVSHSSIGDYLKCPRAYYLNNVYKDPISGHKIKLTSPPLALGQAVHEVIESLSVIPVKDRFIQPLMVKFEAAWKKISGERGGFKDKDQEYLYKKRGMEMIERAVNNPGPLLNLAVKITMNLPYFWLSEEDNIILCGKIDWLEYLPETDSVHIIDFKTGKVDEKSSSLQLPIYYLLVHQCQKRRVTRASYWYLDKNTHLTEVVLPDLKKAKEEVLSIAKEIKLVRTLG
ncbi:PD-(D/E)XK nuclease family protein, partial [Candidatus Gottesmanbacteria bacterium]|nr:PD-(D/E)XK nuclease family protein [Candidatus Gottesmanbacteria bacterium]